MEKEKIRNVKVSKGLAKLIGTAILVDSLIVGVFALGGHVPFHQDTKKINEVVETKTTERANTKEIEVSNDFDNDIDIRNRVVYYQKPYLNEDGVRLRDIETVYYSDSLIPKKSTKTVLVGSNEPDETYVETYQYDINTDHFIRIKENLHDEILSDITLLLILGMMDTAIIAVGKSYIKRKEDEKN